MDCIIALYTHYTCIFIETIRSLLKFLTLKNAEWIYSNNYFLIKQSYHLRNSFPVSMILV